MTESTPVDPRAARASDLARDLNRAHDLVRQLDKAIKRTLYRDLSSENLFLRELNRTRDLARDLNRGLIGAQDLARDLDLDLGQGLDLSREILLYLERDLNAARYQIHNLRFALPKMKAAAYEIERSFAVRRDAARDMSPASLPVPVPVGAVSRWVACTTYLLPLADRATYREVFNAELRDLATAGVTQRGQMAYAVNLTIRTWSLRRALRAPMRGRTR